MRQKSEWRRILARLVIALIVLEVYAFIASRYDARKIAEGEEPTLAIQAAAYFDGGTTIYRGLGYTIVKPRVMAGIRDNAGEIVIGYARQKSAGIKYWIPLWPILKNREASAVYEAREPNQTPQHNAGSRPSSGSLPASEPPPAIAPRG